MSLLEKFSLYCEFQYHEATSLLLGEKKLKSNVLTFDA